MSDNIVSIECSKELRFEGSLVLGSVKLDSQLAKEKGVSAVRVSLKACVHT